MLMAAAPSDVTVDANSVLSGGWYEALTPSQITLTGIGDTSTLAYQWTPKFNGSDVILMRTRWRNPSVDSTAYIINIDCLDKNRNLLYTYAADTSIDTVGKPVKLPLGSICVGSYYNIKIVSATPSTAAKKHTLGTDSLAAYWWLYYPNKVIRTSGSK
jgi:hypothetical protein